MTQSPMDHDNKIILRIRRHVNVRGAMVGVIIGFLSFGGLILLIYWIISFPNGPIFPGLLTVSIIIAIFIFLTILSVPRSVRPLTVEVGTHNISCIEMGQQIFWGPDVHVDVKRDDIFRNHEFGPLAGIRVHSQNCGEISVYAEDGWEIEDVRRLWESIMELIPVKGLQMDDELNWYLKYRKDTGKDR
jgi:hypothetical protein